MADVTGTRKVSAGPGIGAGGDAVLMPWVETRSAHSVAIPDANRDGFGHDR